MKKITLVFILATSFQALAQTPGSMDLSYSKNGKIVSAKNGKALEMQKVVRENYLLLVLMYLMAQKGPL